MARTIVPQADIAAPGYDNSGVDEFGPVSLVRSMVSTRLMTIDEYNAAHV